MNFLRIERIGIPNDDSPSKTVVYQVCIHVSNVSNVDKVVCKGVKNRVFLTSLIVRNGKKTR